ncbi:hypothetical protein SVA_0328 [Sulfurifustis variabilis]|uniref:Uncharacterized protein n=1 Tax=Sulfurifustis variabilis TaxID=1675686 RepID=A0A1B4V0E8_9GAMM|nr:hypothetical protein [Sulfurifustis variabilis]BAU46910.1 hypothetical protein SVA_0328 [Sulfurifustis variabilis]
MPAAPIGAPKLSGPAPRDDYFNYCLTLVLTPMFILSGVFYPVDPLPPRSRASFQIVSCP